MERWWVRDKGREREKRKKNGWRGRGRGRKGVRKRERRRVFFRNLYFTHMNEFYNSTAREYSPLSKEFP